jgi:heme-degrading monooxygenase HmoA
MDKAITTEIASFETVGGMDRREWIKIVDSLEKEFHMKQKGFIDTELVKEEGPNQWMMIQHWRTMEDAREASRQMMKSVSAEQFRNSLDPKTVRLQYLEQMGQWRV